MLEPDDGRQLPPVDWVEEAVLAADRHGWRSLRERPVEGKMKLSATAFGKPLSKQDLAWWGCVSDKPLNASWVVLLASAELLANKETYMQTVHACDFNREGR